MNEIENSLQLFCVQMNAAGRFCRKCYLKFQPRLYRVGQKVSCFIAGCNFVNCAPI